MSRSFLSFTSALAAAALISLGSGAAPAWAQAPSPSGSGSTAAKAPSEQEKAQREAFQGLLNDGNIPKAIEALKKVTRQYPELPSAYVMVFQFLAQPQLNKQALARGVLELAVKETPHDPETFIILGSIAMQERRVTEASLDFGKAKELLTTYTNPKHKKELDQAVLSGTAAVAESREEWTDAESRLQELLKLAPEDLFVHQRLAKAQFEQGHAKEAYETLKVAKKIDKANAAKPGGKEVFPVPEAIMATLYYEVEGYVKSQETKNAETWFMAALKLAPDDLRTRQLVFQWALENDKLDLAKQQADAALRIEAADPKKAGNMGHLLHGVVALWEKKWLQAEEDFKKLIDDDPANFVGTNNIALALCEQDDKAKKERALKYAASNFQTFKDKNPQGVEALSTLGWVNYRCGNFDQAGLALDNVRKATGGQLSSDTATYYAHILHQRQQDWEAKGLLENILQKSSRPFSMRPEAKELYEKVKDTKKPEEKKS